MATFNGFVIMLLHTFMETAHRICMPTWRLISSFIYKFISYNLTWTDLAQLQRSICWPSLFQLNLIVWVRVCVCMCAYAYICLGFGSSSSTLWWKEHIDGWVRKHGSRMTHSNTLMCTLTLTLEQHFFLVNLYRLTICFLSNSYVLNQSIEHSKVILYDELETKFLSLFPTLLFLIWF